MSPAASLSQHWNYYLIVSTQIPCKKRILTHHILLLPLAALYSYTFMLGEKKNLESLRKIVLKCPHVGASTGQGLIHSWRQFVLDHPGKYHKILGHDKQFICQTLPDLIFVRTGIESLSLAADAGDAPDDQVTNVPRDNARVGRERLCGIPNVGNRAFST